MRQLVHDDLNLPILFSENSVHSLIIESPHLLVKVMQELTNQVKGEEGGFALSDDSKTLNIEKSLQIIIDPFSLDCSVRKIQTGIINTLLDQMKEPDMDIQWSELKGKLEVFFQSLAETSDLPLYQTGGFEPSDFLKLAGFAIDIDGLSFLEKVLLFLQVSRTFLGTQVFVFLNFHQYANSSEFESFISTCLYQKYDMLFLESQKPNSILENEKVLIIDSDLCEI